MASTTVDYAITGGPSRFDLQASVFDIENPRLLQFGVMFNFPGSALVQVVGATQGDTSQEEFHLTGWFMPNGLHDTKLADTVAFEANYSPRLRRGIMHIETTSLGGHPVATAELIAWMSPRRE